MSLTQFLIIGTALVTLSVTASAENTDAGVPDEMLQKIKQNMINGMHDRITIIKNGISCIEQADGKESLRACKHSQKEAMRAHRQNRRDRKAQMRSGFGRS